MAGFITTPRKRTEAGSSSRTLAPRGNPGSPDSDAAHYVVDRIQKWFASGRAGDPAVEVEHLIITLPNDWSFAIYRLWHEANRRTPEERAVVDDFQYATGRILDLFSRGEIPKIFEMPDAPLQPLEEFEEDPEEDPEVEPMMDSDDEDIISWTESPPPVPIIEILSSDDED